LIVETYRNLHRGCISVRRKGLVKQCTAKIALTNATFVVQQGGRKRVLREKRKNVHAFVKGTPTHKPPPRGLLSARRHLQPLQVGQLRHQEGQAARAVCHLRRRASVRRDDLAVLRPRPAELARPRRRS